MTFYGKIKKSELLLINSKEVSRLVGVVGDASLVKITLEVVEDCPEFNWMGYIHKVLIPGFRAALVHCGNEVRKDSDAKLIMKEMFLTTSIYVESKQDYEDVTKDLSTLTGPERSKLIDEVIRFCAMHMGVRIKYPGEK